MLHLQYVSAQNQTQTWRAIIWNKKDRRTIWFEVMLGIFNLFINLTTKCLTFGTLTSDSARLLRIPTTPFPNLELAKIQYWDYRGLCRRHSDWWCLRTLSHQQWHSQFNGTPSFFIDGHHPFHWLHPTWLHPTNCNHLFCLQRLYYLWVKNLYV